MVGKVLYGVLGGGSLVLWVAAANLGWGGSDKSYQVPQSVRQSPGGYRSFAFWHSGYQAGK
jgi:hypothetical protein